MLKHTISILYYQSVLVFGSYKTVAAFSIVLGFFVYAVTRKVQGNSAGSGLLSEERADIKLRGIHSWSFMERLKFGTPTPCLC